MQQNQCLAVAPLNIMEADAAYVDEFADGRIVTLGFLRHQAIDECRDCERCNHGRRPHYDGMRRDICARMASGG